MGKLALYALAAIVVASNVDGDTDCPAMNCTEQYIPVCGINGVTYRNRCVMRSMNCGNDILAYTAACQPEADCGIFVLCAEGGSYVCGSDGVTYRNYCAMFHQNCNNVTIIADGECPE